MVVEDWVSACGLVEEMLSRGEPFGCHYFAIAKGRPDPPRNEPKGKGSLKGYGFESAIIDQRHCG